jgi:ribose/xylose/arabinose/galactoside ABC-type transport system permease subunit
MRLIWNVLGPFLGLALVTLIFAYLTRAEGTFLTPVTWRTILVQSVIVGIAALGMTLIMIAGGIDLSVGSSVALVAVCIASLTAGFECQIQLPGMTQSWNFGQIRLPVAIAMGCGIAVGGLCGLFNGMLITRLGVVPFIITLGSLKIFRGLAKWFSGSNQVYGFGAEDTPPPWIDQILATEPEPAWLLVSPGVWLWLALSLLLALVLRRSLLGRYAYAVGSNEATARLCGINVPGVKLMVYSIAGLLTGLAGVMQFLYFHAEGDPTACDGLELSVIAAVVVGGGSLSGGEGTVLGTLIGCLIMSVLENGCVHAGIPPAAKDILIGAIIIAAVTVDQLRRRSRRKS